MKKILILFLLVSQAAIANERDFGTSEGQIIPLEKLKYQMEVQADVLVFDKNTSRLLFKGSEERKWQFGNEGPIEKTWAFGRTGLPSFILKHSWKFDNQGKLIAKIQQFEASDSPSPDDLKIGKLFKEKEYSLDNLESINWVIGEKDTKRLVVRFQVEVWSTNDAVDIGKLAINSSRMTIYDGRGQLWASRVKNEDGNNVYVGLQTHRGSFFISYVPFKGAKKIGYAEKNRIRLEDGNQKVHIESAEPFLPRGVTANVYGLIDVNKRTESYSSIRSMTSDREESFLKRIQE